MNQKKKKKDLRKRSGGWGNVTQSDLAVPEVRTIPHETATWEQMRRIIMKGVE